jgi:hypothetical protein
MSKELSLLLILITSYCMRESGEEAVIVGRECTGSHHGLAKPFEYTFDFTVRTVTTSPFAV